MQTEPKGFVLTCADAFTPGGGIPLSVATLSVVTLIVAELNVFLLVFVAANWSLSRRVGWAHRANCCIMGRKDGGGAASRGNGSRLIRGFTCSLVNVLLTSATDDMFLQQGAESDQNPIKA